MVVTKGKIKGFSANRIWFWRGEKLKLFKTVFNRYLRVDSSYMENFLSTDYVVDEVYTLVSDLSVGEDELFGHLKKKYKNEIRRAQTDGNTIEYYEANELLAKPEILSDFRKTYIVFCKQLDNKKLIKDLDMKKVRSYIDENCILISRIKNEKNDILVYHLYVVDSRNALLCYSASVFRTGNTDRAAAGRANKQLHWEDMKYFSKKGISTYDWGNVSVGTPENYNGIDKFKAGFGGRQVKISNVLTSESFIGKLIIRVLNKL